VYDLRKLVQAQARVVSCLCVALMVLRFVLVNLLFAVLVMHVLGWFWQLYSACKVQGHSWLLSHGFASFLTGWVCSQLQRLSTAGFTERSKAVACFPARALLSQQAGA
jgi:hypothetical protein